MKSPSCDTKPTDAELKKILSPEQYEIVKKNGTELPLKRLIGIIKNRDLCGYHFTKTTF